MKRLDANAIPVLECDRCKVKIRPSYCIQGGVGDENQIIYDHFCVVKFTVAQLTSLYGVIRQDIKDGQQ